MSMDLSTPDALTKIMKAAGSDQPETLTKRCYEWALAKGAEQGRRANETEAQAFRRYANTDEGRTLYSAMMKAPHGA